MKHKHILVLHGIHGSRKKMKYLTDHLQQHNFLVHSIDFQPASGEYGLEKLSEQVHNYVEKFLVNQPFHAIAFSMGGHCAETLLIFL